MHQQALTALRLVDEILPVTHGYLLKGRAPPKLAFRSPKCVCAVYLTNGRPRGS